MRKLVVLCAVVIMMVLTDGVPVGAGISPQVSVTPTQGSPGTPLHIEGNCGISGEREVFIAFVIHESDVTLATTTSASDGSFAADTQAPQIAPPVIVSGAGAIVVLCESAEAVPFSTPFTLLDDLEGPVPSTVTTTSTTASPTIVVEDPPPRPIPRQPNFTG